MAWRALLAALSPHRFRRWRLVRPGGGRDGSCSAKVREGRFRKDHDLFVQGLVAAGEPPQRDPHRASRTDELDFVERGGAPRSVTRRSTARAPGISEAITWKSVCSLQPSWMSSTPRSCG